MKQFLSLTANGKINFVLALMPFLGSIVGVTALILNAWEDVVSYIDLASSKTEAYYTVFGVIPLLVLFLVINTAYISKHLVKTVLEDEAKLKQMVRS